MKEDKYTKLKKGKKEAKNANSKAGKCLGTVYIIHGWDGNVSKYWYPRTIKTLTEKGFKVYALEMPNPATPSIDEWVGYMKKKVKMDEKTFFIGHSIGCQTILRFLASQNMHAAGCIFVAGWFDLLEYTYTEEPKYEDIVRKIAASWINTPLDFAAAKKNSGMVTAIFSDNDYYVDLSNVPIFKERLDAKIIIEHDKGHFGAKENFKELPVVVNELVTMQKILDKKS